MGSEIQRSLVKPKTLLYLVKEKANRQTAIGLLAVMAAPSFLVRWQGEDASVPIHPEEGVTVRGSVNGESMGVHLLLPD